MQLTSKIATFGKVSWMSKVDMHVFSRMLQNILENTDFLQYEMCTLY